MINRKSECETLSCVPRNFKYPTHKKGLLATRPHTACSSPHKRLADPSWLQLCPEPGKSTVFFPLHSSHFRSAADTGNNTAPSSGGASRGLVSPFFFSSPHRNVSDNSKVPVSESGLTIGDHLTCIRQSGVVALILFKSEFKD